MTKLYTLIVAFITTFKQRLEQRQQLDPEAGLTTVEWSILIALGAVAATAFGAAAVAAINSQTSQLPGQ